MNDQVRVEQVKEIVEQLVEEEVQASRFQAFADYAEACRAMQDDPLVRFIERQITRLDEELRRAEKLYEAAMDEAGREIKVIVLELRQTVEVAGVTASYHKGRQSPSWKSVAMTFKPSQELIEEHTRVGKPSVRIKMVDVEGVA